MTAQIPSYEHPKLQAAGLRTNLKFVIETVKAIDDSLAEIQADTSGRDRSVTTTVLKQNKIGIMQHGKKLQERIRMLEGNS